MNRALGWVVLGRERLSPSKLLVIFLLFKFEAVLRANLAALLQ